MSASSEEESLNPLSVPNKESSFLKLSYKSRKIYTRKYEQFMNWMRLKDVKSVSEEVLLEYFKELAKTLRAPTVLSSYYTLKSKLSSEKGIEIGNYKNLVAFLKRQVKEHTCQRNKVFTFSEVETFLNKAPDRNFLAIKVALIFGVRGACRSTELVKLRVTDIQKHSENIMIVNIMSSPTKLERSFMILDKEMEIVTKYMSLRPKFLRTDRFFLDYHRGKCKRQVIGLVRLVRFPTKIATFLKLPNPELYIGECFRRSAANLLTQSDHMQMGSKKPTVPSKNEKDVKSSKQSHLHSTDVTVKVERVGSKVPFDFIDVAVPPVQSQPNSPRSTPRRRPTQKRDLFSLTIKLLHQQLQRDEEREREEHNREMRYLREEERQLEVEAECNAVLKGLADVVMNFLEKPTVNGDVTARH